MSGRDAVRRGPVDRAVPEPATPAFPLTHRDRLERAGGWLLIRRSLGLGSFGMNIVEIPPGGSIPEHDEAERHPAPEGTLARLDPEPRRTVVNDGTESAAVLIASAPRTSGYEPMEWA